MVDANSAPLSAQHRHRAKTDRHDAEVLVHACRLGAYPPTHRTAKRWRHVQTVMSVREALRDRARWSGVVRVLVRQHGYRLSSGAVETLVRRVERLSR
jgi:hypothetical protein